MKIIEFEGKTYPSVLVNMPFGERRISTETLNESLMNFDGSYVSENARIVDEEIFYFVAEESISIENYKLVKLILSEI